MNCEEFKQNLINFTMINPIWDKATQIIKCKNTDKILSDEIKKIFLIFMVFLDEGCVSISLNKDELLNKWNTKMNRMDILSKEDTRLQQSIIADSVYCLDDIREEGKVAINFLDSIDSESLCDYIDETDLFKTDKNNLYIRKTYKAKDGIEKSIIELFKHLESKETTLDFASVINFDNKLHENQKEAIINASKYKSMIVTGRPGTGKTTVAIYMIISILCNNPNYNVYLAAPSGKASQRMKESFESTLKKKDTDPLSINSDFKKSNEKIIDKLRFCKRGTIHSLLGTDFQSGWFLHTEQNKLEDYSIYVIDEASMIDIYTFDALLKAIPENSRLIIMGDKDQLPSVDSGSVFEAMVSNTYLKDYIVELTYSNRFKKGSPIYELAEWVNSNTSLFPGITNIEPEEFSPFIDQHKLILINDMNHTNFKDERSMIKSLADEWSKFYLDIETANGTIHKASLQELAYNIETPEPQLKEDIDVIEDENVKIALSDIDEKLEKTILDYIYDYSLKCKVLCSENNFIRGASTFNKYIYKKTIDYTEGKEAKFLSNNGHFTGEVLMITRNIKSLELYNGDTGVTVKFENDENIYLMIKKSVEFISHNGKTEDSNGQVFKIDHYVFYPITFISDDDIDYAFAITIHKSQGSEYPNILVVLPKTPGHPLLNRQIVYTGITRTCGQTFILGNEETLKSARDTRIDRDTKLDL